MALKKTLVSWIGMADLASARSQNPDDLGPICQTVRARAPSRVILLADLKASETALMASWMQSLDMPIPEIRDHSLPSPVHFGGIYEAARTTLLALEADRDSESEIEILLSPGTPAMAAIWILLAKTIFPCRLLESSKQNGVNEATIPFDISVDYLPDLMQKQDQQMRDLVAGVSDENAAFSDIICRSPIMKRLVDRAQRAAVRNVPILLLGETGTGKEMFAHAIHDASSRRCEAKITVNCGAIPAELIESELFGHVKGSFTGAIRDRIGHIEAAHRGTLFLDEIGDLPLSSQVKLLRVLQEGELVRVGATQSIQVDVRIIAATHLDLYGQIREGHFRSDLFHRLAVAVLTIPPLRERPEDISPLIDLFIGEMDEKFDPLAGDKRKILSVSGKNLLKNYRWPGNVRELRNTLIRAFLWSDEDVLGHEQVADSILPLDKATERVLDRSFIETFDIQEVMAEVARHYLHRALIESGGQRKKAAELLGLNSHQTLKGWLERFGVES